MKIEKVGNVTHIVADDGRMVRRKNDPSTACVEAYLSVVDSVDLWEDCDSSDEPTMADKDAALRRFGVEM